MSETLPSSPDLAAAAFDPHCALALAQRTLSASNVER